MKITLSPIERKALKAEAHALDPVVLIGDQGLTAAVLKEIDRSLKAHALIKVRAATDEREQREAWLAEIADALNAAPVQHIGKMLVVWRKKPEEKKKTADTRTTAKRPVGRGGGGRKPRAESSRSGQPTTRRRSVAR